MADIRLHLITLAGDSHPIDTPDDIKTEQFIREVVAGLKLAVTDAAGLPASWIIDDKDTGRTLEAQNTLAANGVAAGHHLHMRRQVIAGS